MDSLKIRTGQVSLNILDDLGNSRGVFTFNPTDVESAKRIYALQSEIAHKDEELQKQAEMCETTEQKIELLTESVRYYRGIIDECFGEGTSQLLFGNNNSLSMFFDFFEGIMPYYQKASEDRMAKYNTNKFKSGK